MTDGVRELRLHDSWSPPLAVAGATATPYPVHAAAKWSWVDSETAFREIDNARLRMLLPPLAANARAEVALRGLPTAVFGRTASEHWEVDPAGIAKLASHIRRAGFAPRKLLGADYFEDELRFFLQTSLRDQNWFAPTAAPSLSAALTSFFTQTYLGIKPSDDRIYPGERARAATIKNRDYEDERFEPWSSRASRRHVELMIATSGRVAPFRLRPLVLTKRNAARKEWHYGGWGVYDALPNGDPGAFLAIYGRSANGQWETWHEVRWDTVQWLRPEPDVRGLKIEWYGLHLDRHSGGFAEVRCAITDAVLGEWSPTPAANERPPQAFLPMEVTLPPLEDNDVYRLVSHGAGERSLGPTPS